MLTLAGFEALQLVKLSETWSLWLGRVSVFGNTPSFHSCSDPGIFSELAVTPFLCTETSPPEDGTRSRVGSREAVLRRTGWKLNINVHLLLPAWKSHSHSILTWTVVVRAGLSFQAVIDPPVPQQPQLNAPRGLHLIALCFGSLLISYNRLKRSGLTFQFTRKSCLVWSNWISFLELREGI